MRFAVIPTHNKPDELHECLASLIGQVNVAIVIDNASDPPVDIPTTTDLPIIIVRDPEQPPNLSRLWNIGIRMARNLMGEDEDNHIAILNDDAVVPPGWADSLINVMQTLKATAACTDPWRTSGHPVQHRGAILSVMERMVGWAFILDGNAPILADEDLRWWYGDTALDLEARRLGGTVIVPGPPVANKHANMSTTGLLAEQAGKDRATYEIKYGHLPW